MQELNIFEVEAVSGGASHGVLDSIAGAVNMASDCAWAGAILGGRYGGSNGGLLGFGSIASGVGLVYGAIYGAVGGAVVGLVNGDQDTKTVQNGIVDSITSGKMTQGGVTSVS